MTESEPAPLPERVAAALPGWVLLVCGVAVAGAAVLVPSWLEVRQLRWQQEVMEMQARQLQQQASGYERFREALAADDPVLLERLAFVHLRVKPAGVSPLVVPVSQRGGPGVGVLRRGADHGAMPELTLLDPSASIDAWLHTPMPREGVDYQAYQPIQSRLVRLTTGISRLVLLVAGLCFVAAGLWATPVGDQRDVRPELRREVLGDRLKAMWGRMKRRRLGA